MFAYLYSNAIPYPMNLAEGNTRYDIYMHTELQWMNQRTVCKYLLNLNQDKVNEQQKSSNKRQPNSSMLLMRTILHCRLYMLYFSCNWLPQEENKQHNSYFCYELYIKRDERSMSIIQLRSTKFPFKITQNIIQEFNPYWSTWLLKHTFRISYRTNGLN